MATATETLTNVLHELDGGGDTKLYWNPDNADEVDAARAHFDKLIARQHLAFRMDRSGNKGEQIRSFDRDAERILMVPRSVGG